MEFLLLEWNLAVHINDFSAPYKSTVECYGTVVYKFLKEAQGPKAYRLALGLRMRSWCYFNLDQYQKRDGYPTLLVVLQTILKTAWYILFMQYVNFDLWIGLKSSLTVFSRVYSWILWFYLFIFADVELQTGLMMNGCLKSAMIPQITDVWK